MGEWYRVIELQAEPSLAIGLPCPVGPQFCAWDASPLARGLAGHASFPSTFVGVVRDDDPFRQGEAGVRRFLGRLFGGRRSC